MSIKQAQEWLNQQPGIDNPLYSVMVQLDGDGEYSMVWIDMGHLETTILINFADWVDRDTAQEIAKRTIGDLCRFDGEEREITRAFIVEKSADYRVVEEVHADAT
ncbi:hypothetical protein QP933_06905 [Corynebacterium pseudodiphtheriticum]|uniref:hypothetical protein n=1 Tax=Corynebacterium pseudodiphtheriticum TaxID=37637 RepID=UPI00254A1D58|nr:hypothetical protein [Corynebacterium pseudodiphtheriticum]MDK8500668.1 hypothetical protein [Corynebacterium pseudodiphtheriticum]MDK8775772.1 hypothetical protein [Corynebacterium pseudodiphtheriticum]